MGGTWEGVEDLALGPGGGGGSDGEDPVCAGALPGGVGEPSPPDGDPPALFPPEGGVGPPLGALALAPSGLEAPELAPSVDGFLEDLSAPGALPEGGGKFAPPAGDAPAEPAVGGFVLSEAVVVGLEVCPGAGLLGGEALSPPELHGQGFWETWSSPSSW